MLALHPQHSSSSSRTTSVPTPPQPPQPPLHSLSPQRRQLHVDIGNVPTTDLLKKLAEVLARIAAANDKLRHNSIPQPTTGNGSGSGVFNTLTTAAKASLGSTSASLSFHARNIPTISIESYLMRILKYCPTTNEVFLSLLVYFDRMGKLGDAVKSDLGINYGTGGTEEAGIGIGSGGGIVIDSYNVHRLIIAGVTVASKFFSDVFYTNSRYAKVGGLPQSELNQLELQFLLLNDFRLVIPLEELQRYADQLLVYNNVASAAQLPEDEFGFFREKIEPVPVIGYQHLSPQHYIASQSPARSSLLREAPAPPYTGPQPIASTSSSSLLRNAPTLSERPHITVPPPLHHAPNSYSSSSASDDSNSTNTSTAPTPTSSTSTITQTKLQDGESSLVSTPTSTSISFVDTEEGTQVEEDRDPEDDHKPRSSDEEDDDPTVRVNGNSATVQDARTPGPIHSQYSSYSSYQDTELGENEVRSEEEDNVLVGRKFIPINIVNKRDESPVASLKYVNGVWDRGELPSSFQNNANGISGQQRRRLDEDEVDPGDETQDEVVYKGASSSGLGGGMLMNGYGMGLGLSNGVGAVGMMRKAQNSSGLSGSNGSGTSVAVSANGVGSR